MNVEHVKMLESKEATHRVVGKPNFKLGLIPASLVYSPQDLGRHAVF